MLRHFASVMAVLIVALIWNPGSASAQEDLVNTLSSVEKSLWEAWKNHDAAPFQEHLLENAVTIGGWGMESGKQAAIQSVESHDCGVKDYSFSDWAVHRLSDNVAVLTYKADQDVVCGGETAPANIVASSIYVRKGDQWMVGSYHETEIDHQH